MKAPLLLGVAQCTAAPPRLPVESALQAAWTMLAGRRMAAEAVEVVVGMHADEAEAMFLHVRSDSCSQTAFMFAAPTV